MSKRVRIGVAGAGVFGAHHAAKYSEHKKSVLAAIFDIDANRADKLAAKFGAAAFGDFDEFLIDLDAVIIATPAHSHFEYAAKALRADRHVFIEKPLALNLDEADALITIAAARELVLQVGHQERYVVEAAGLLRRKRLPLRVECRRCAPPTGRGMDVSVVFDLMVHDLDLVRQITGSDVEHVEARGNDDETEVDLVLENGVVASLTADRTASDFDRRLTLHYDDGVVDIDFANRKIQNSTPALITDNFGCDAGNQPAFDDPLAYGADRFLVSILNGVAPIVTGQHGRAAIAWALKIEQAKAESNGVLAMAGERLRA